MKRHASRFARVRSIVTTGVVATVIAVATSAGTAAAAVEADGTVSPDIAAATAEVCGTLNPQQGGSAPVMSELGGPAADDALALAGDALAEGALTVASPDSALMRSEGRAHTITVADTTTTSVTFPLSGNGMVPPSNLTLVFDEGGAIIQYAETRVVETSDGSYDLTTLVDGAVIQQMQFDPRMLIDPLAPTAPIASGASIQSASGTDPIACIMVVLGVGSITAGIILALCGGSCSVPVTAPTAAICAACIGGIATIGGASIAAVMGCMNGR